MEVRQTVAAALDRAPQFFGHGFVGVHVQQYAARVAHQTIGPIGDDQGANDAHDRIHKDPAEKAPEEQSAYREHRNPASAATCMKAARMLLSR